MKTTNPMFKRFATKLQFAVAALAFLSLCPTQIFAQEEHAHAQLTPQQIAADAQNDPNNLLKVVRQATERYKDVAAAEAAGYQLQFGCVSGDDFGAMGLHYINGDLVNGGILDPTRPQIVIYEPTPNGGKPKLIGADFLVLADQWNAGHAAPPQMMGQMFHLFTAPNRFGLPAFYTLHVWAWKENPKGAFVNWHSEVSCKSFSSK